MINKKFFMVIEFSGSFCIHSLKLSNIIDKISLYNIWENPNYKV